MRYLLAVIYLLSLSGCATIFVPHYNVTVDAVAAKDALDKKSYVLMPANIGTSWNDTEFREVANYVWRSLNTRGYVFTKNVNEADLRIEVSYGISAPKAEQYIDYVPIMSTIPSGNSVAVVITGYREETRTRYLYYKYLSIAGFDYSLQKTPQSIVEIGANSGKGNKAPLWKTTVSNNDGTDDLTNLIPVFVTAAIPYIATNIDQQKQLSISDEDLTLTMIRGKPSNEVDHKQ